MGFGLLFIGYFTATLMSINTFGSSFKLVGYGIMLIASGKLKKYNRAFTYLELTAYIMLAFSALLAVSDIWIFLYDEMLVDSNPFGGAYPTVIIYAEILLSLVYNTVMLYAIRRIAVETEAEKIAASSVRNFIFICVYYVLYFIGVFPFTFADTYLKYCGAFILLFNFVWIILNLVLIYSCYARICDENDIEMNRKLSRFAFVNKMRAESEERQARAAERQAEYRRQRQEKRERRKR